MRLLNNCIKENFWLTHFLSRQSAYVQQGRDWIDFEREISSVIKRVEQLISEAVSVNEEDISVGPFYPNNEPEKFAELLKFCRVYFRPKYRDPKRTYTYEDVRKLIEALHKDLEKFTTAIEIYLGVCTRYVESANGISLTDIDAIGQIQKVLSFNYANTFMRYLPANADLKRDICFIHGGIWERPDSSKSPLVLGIDEYLKEPERDEKENFAVFKKYFQRIFKGTGYNYNSWHNDAQLELQQLSNSEPGNYDGWAIHLYIFGHSLDITDKDVLHKIITNSSTKTTIFYRNDHQLETEIQNLIKIIGSNDLNERTRGIQRSIYFKRQQG